jgi:hypothetical protein
MCPTSNRVDYDTIPIIIPLIRVWTDRRTLVIDLNNRIISIVPI